MYPVHVCRSCLIVDADSARATHLHQALTEHGLACTACTSRAEALRLLEQQHFDALVLSERVKDGAGRVLAERLHRPEGIPHVVLLGDSPRSEHLRDLRTGVVDYYIRRHGLDDTAALVVHALRAPAG